MENDKERERRIRHYAKTCYESYCEAVGGKSAVTGDPLPAYNKTNATVQKGWEAVAEAFEIFTQEHKKLEKDTLMAQGKSTDLHIALDNLLQDMQRSDEVDHFTKLWSTRQYADKIVQKYDAEEQKRFNEH